MNTTEVKAMSSGTVAISGSMRRTRRFGARLARVLGASVLVLGSLHAHADDYIHVPYNIANFNANFGNLPVPASLAPPRDVAVGTVLQTIAVNSKISYGASCNVSKIGTVNGTPVPGMTDTYQTNVPGIGVHFYVTAGWSGSTYISVPSNETLSPSSSGPTTFYTRADLVATGPIGNGTLTTLPSMTLSYSGSCETSYAKVQALDTGTVISGRTCSVTTPSVRVTLPTIFPGNLNTGATGATPLSLGVNCAEGIAVKVTLTDASNVGNTTNTLGLTSDSTATGVGLQILNGSTPIAYGQDSAIAGNTNQWSAGTAAGGPMTIPLTVRYVRTSDALTPGTVKGTATFTMSYQ